MDSQVFPWPSSNKSKSPWEKRRSVPNYCKFDPLVGKIISNLIKFVSNEISLVNHHLIRLRLAAVFSQTNWAVCTQTILKLQGTCLSKVARMILRITLFAVIFGGGMCFM